jgi:GNAT superfamily N-acetyltransferase
MILGPITYYRLDGAQALTHLDELRDIYTEVYAEPPYQWGQEHADLFVERFHGQARQPGFAMVEARHGPGLIGVALGVTLQPATPWWRHLTTPLPDDITTEWTGRTFALVELLVRRPWRRQHIAQTMHDLLLQRRPEERATLTVLPAAQPAREAYISWGWQLITQKRNPLPGSPLFDVMVKDLIQFSDPPPNERG